MIRCDMRWFLIEMAFMAFVAAMSTNAFGLYQAVQPIFAALLARLFEIQRDVALAFHATTFQPGLFDQSQEAAVDLGVGTFRFI